MSFDDDVEEEKKEALAAFERLEHKLRGEVEVEWSWMCCGGYWFVLRCDRCNWYWTFDPCLTREFNGPKHLPSPICLGYHKDP